VKAADTAQGGENETLAHFGIAGMCYSAQTIDEPVVLTIDVENYVQYRGDVLDPAKAAKDPNPTTGVVNTFLPNFMVGDIVAVNGKPAKGLWQNTLTIMPFRANPSPGATDSRPRFEWHCSVCVGDPGT